MTPKKRLDTLLIEKGLAPNPEKAQYLIMTGNILVNDHKIVKSGHLVSSEATIQVLADFPKYVSRGGDKLAGAHQAFKFEITNRVVLDIGQSTGGFSDYLLQNNAQAIIGVDVGYGQLDLKIRNHPNVYPIERTNARHLTPALLQEKLKTMPKAIGLLSQIQLVVMDVSFISVTKILPILSPLVQPEADYIILIKPQFEAQREWVSKGGIIKDEPTRQKTLDHVEQSLNTHHFYLKQKCESPIEGTKGNQESFFWLKNV